MKRQGKPVVEPQLPLLIKQNRDNFCRVAQESEVPTIKLEEHKSKLYDHNS